MLFRSAELKKLAKRKKLPFLAISSATGEGIDKLIYLLAERLRELRASEPGVDQITLEEDAGDILSEIGVEQRPTPPSPRRAAKSRTKEKSTQ